MFGSGAGFPHCRRRAPAHCGDRTSAPPTVRRDVTRQIGTPWRAGPRAQPGRSVEPAARHPGRARWPAHCWLLKVPRQTWTGSAVFRPGSPAAARPPKDPTPCLVGRRHPRMVPTPGVFDIACRTPSVAALGGGPRAPSVIDAVSSATPRIAAGFSAASGRGAWGCRGWGRCRPPAPVPRGLLPLGLKAPGPDSLAHSASPDAAGPLAFLR